MYVFIPSDCSWKTEKQTEIDKLDQNIDIKRELVEKYRTEANERRKELYTLKPDKNSKDNVLYAISRYIMAIDSTVRFCINAIIDYAYSGFGCRGGKHGVFFYDDESSAIKKVMVRIAETAKVAKQTVADWLVMAANAIGHFNDWELRRAEKEVKDVADGLYDGRIEKYENGKGMRI